MRPDGKLSPLVEIDVSARPDIDALFAAYSPDTVGDVALQWGQREGAPKGSITLFVLFTAPIRLLVILDFDIVRQGVVVDEILRSGELYLQGISSTHGGKPTRSSRVRVAIPDTHFGPIWEELLVRELAAQARALGATARHAEVLAKESIRRWRLGPH